MHQQHQQPNSCQFSLVFYNSCTLQIFISKIIHTLAFCSFEYLNIGECDSDVMLCERDRERVRERENENESLFDVTVTYAWALNAVVYNKIWQMNGRHVI